MLPMPDLTLRMFSQSLMLAMVVALAGCQANQTPFVPQAIKQPGNGKIFVYWPAQTWREKSGSSPEVRLNGIPVGVLRYKSYIELETTAGTYELRMTGDSAAADWEGADQAFTAPLEAGEIKYVRLLVKYDQETNRLGQGFMDHVVQFLPRAEKEARLEMYGLKKISD